VKSFFFFLLKLCLFAGSGKAFTSVGIQGGAQPGIIQQAITYVTANVQQQNAQNPEVDDSVVLLRKSFVQFSLKDVLNFCCFFVHVCNTVPKH